MLFIDQVTDTSTTPKRALGTVREEANKEYIYAYTASAISPYRAVVLASGVSNITVSPVTVAAVASGDASVAFGVTQNTIPASSYFWLLQKGFGSVEQVSVSGCLSPAKLVVASTSGTVSAFAGTLNSANHVPLGYSEAGLGVATLVIPAFIDCK